MAAEQDLQRQANQSRAGAGAFAGVTQDVREGSRPVRVDDPALKTYQSVFLNRADPYILTRDELAAEIRRRLEEQTYWEQIGVKGVPIDATGRVELNNVGTWTAIREDLVNSVSNGSPGQEPHYTRNPDFCGKGGMDWENPQRLTALDIGSGGYSRSLKELEYQGIPSRQIVGLEINPLLAAASANNHSESTIVLADFTQIPQEFMTGLFDVVNCRFPWLFSARDSENNVQIFQRMGEIVKQGGCARMMTEDSRNALAAENAWRARGDGSVESWQTGGVYFVEFYKHLPH